MQSPSITCVLGGHRETRRLWGQKRVRGSDGRRHRNIAIWELLLLIQSCNKMGEDGQFACDVGTI
jgi:hypothetical protein